MWLLAADFDVLRQGGEQVVQVRLFIVYLSEAVLKPQQLLYLIQCDMIRHSLIIEMKNPIELTADDSMALYWLILLSLVRIIL